MAKVQFKQRLGSDLFSYMKLSTVSQDRANEQALEKYVTIDNKPLTLEDICKLKPTVKDRLIGSVFSMRTPTDFLVDDDEINYIHSDSVSYTVKKTVIKTSLLTAIQVKFANNQSNPTKALKQGLTMMFDLTETEIDKMPYELVAGLINEMNSFLKLCTESTSEFEIDSNDIFQD